MVRTNEILPGGLPLVALMEGVAKERGKFRLPLLVGAHHEDLLGVTRIVAIDCLAQSVVSVRILRFRGQQVESSLSEVAAWGLVRQLRQTAPRCRGNARRIRVPAEAEALDVAWPICLPSLAGLAVVVLDVLRVVLVANARFAALATAEAPGFGRLGGIIADFSRGHSRIDESGAQDVGRSICRGFCICWGFCDYWRPGSVVVISVWKRSKHGG